MKKRSVFFLILIFILISFFSVMLSGFISAENKNSKNKIENSLRVTADGRIYLDLGSAPLEAETDSGDKIALFFNDTLAMNCPWYKKLFRMCSDGELFKKFSLAYLCEEDFDCPDELEGLIEENGRWVPAKMSFICEDSFCVSQTEKIKPATLSEIRGDFLNNLKNFFSLNWILGTKEVLPVSGTAGPSADPTPGSSPDINYCINLLPMCGRFPYGDGIIDCTSYCPDGQNCISPERNEIIYTGSCGYCDLKTCADYSEFCGGNLYDGCGGLLNCDCPSGQVCSGEICECVSGQKCNGNCIDTSSDNNNCGSCGNICTGGKTCQSGVCSCTNGETKECGSSSIGECRKGIQTCVSGNWGSCIGNIEPSTEICDGKDNDCDGIVDEGCSCTNGQTRSCGLNIGECRNGVQTCTGGNWGDCAGDVKPISEICDGKDNDCDGVNDNGFDKTDNYNCGRCGNTCSSGQSCKNGECIENLPRIEVNPDINFANAALILRENANSIDCDVTSPGDSKKTLTFDFSEGSLTSYEPILGLKSNTNYNVNCIINSNPVSVSFKTLAECRDDKDCEKIDSCKYCKKNSGFSLGSCVWAEENKKVGDKYCCKISSGSDELKLLNSQCKIPGECSSDEDCPACFACENLEVKVYEKEKNILSGDFWNTAGETEMRPFYKSIFLISKKEPVNVYSKVLSSKTTGSSKCVPVAGCQVIEKVVIGIRECGLGFEEFGLESLPDADSFEEFGLSEMKFGVTGFAGGGKKCKCKYKNGEQQGCKKDEICVKIDPRNSWSTDCYNPCSNIDIEEKCKKGTAVFVNKNDGTIFTLDEKKIYHLNEEKKEFLCACLSIQEKKLDELLKNLNMKGPEEIRRDIERIERNKRKAHEKNFKEWFKNAGRDAFIGNGVGVGGGVAGGGGGGFINIFAIAKMGEEITNALQAPFTSMANKILSGKIGTLPKKESEKSMPLDDLKTTSDCKKQFGGHGVLNGEICIDGRKQEKQFADFKFKRLGTNA